MTAGFRAMADLKRRHVCSYDGCDYSTMRMPDLKRHKNAHDGSSHPFACDHIGCAYTTVWLANLNRHKRSHDRVRSSFACRHIDCSYVAVDSIALNCHERAHLLPYACDYVGCTYRAGESGTLKRHKNVVHYGLFACDYIGCAFTAGSSGALNNHQQTHIRTCVCDHPDCNEAFSTPRRLAVHIRTHSAVATTGCENRPIPGVPGYMASSHGYVFNLAGNAMAQQIVSGYARVCLMVDGVRKVGYVHRLVALAFHGLPPDKSYTVDHIDRIKTNNNESNLRWATRSEQAANQTQPDKHPAQWRPVVITSAAGKVSEFRSVAEAVKSLGLPKDSSTSKLERALRSGETWRYNDTAREGVTYRPIPSSAIGGKEGYNAGDDGSILLASGRVTFGSFDPSGYRRWGNHLMHRLVAAAFLPLDVTREVVNHRNGVKHDNQLSNLEYVTQSENTRHAYVSGLATGRAIIGTQAAGAETRFQSIAEAARAVGVTGNAVRRHIGRTTTFREYTWKYVT